MAPLKIRLKLPSNPSSEPSVVSSASTSVPVSASASNTSSLTPRPRLILKHRPSQQSVKVASSSPYPKDQQDDSVKEEVEDDESEGYSESDGDQAYPYTDSTFDQPPSSDKIHKDQSLADSSDASSEVEPEPMDVDEEDQDQNSDQSQELEEDADGDDDEDEDEEEEEDDDEEQDKEEATPNAYAYDSNRPSSSRLLPSGSSPVSSQRSTPVVIPSPVSSSSVLPTVPATAPSATMLRLPKLILKNASNAVHSDAIRTPTSIILSRPEKPSGPSKKASRTDRPVSSKPAKTADKPSGELPIKEIKKKKKKKDKENHSTSTPWPPPPPPPTTTTTEPSPIPPSAGPSSSFAPSPDPYVPLTPSFPSPSQFTESRQVSETPEPPEELQSYIAPNGTKAFVRAKGVNGRKIVGGQLQKPLKEVCERLLKEIGRRDDYQFFLNPVSEKEVPGYHSIIKNPISLSVMEQKLSQGLYHKFDLFEADLRLIFTNCITFNPPSTIFSTTALKLLSWFERHLPTYRELILPETDNKEDSTLRSRSPSVFDEQGEPSPAPSGLADEDGAMTPNGPGQAGRKRGPYKTAGGSGSTTAGPAGGATAGGGPAGGTDKSQAGSFDEEGVLKGAGMFGYDPVVWGAIHWWETGGRRLKNKREITKLTSRGNEYIPCMPDGSRDLSELEHLTPSFDVFLRRPMSVPRLISLPANFLATNARPISAEDLASLNPPLPSLIPPPSDDCYLPLTSDELPPAFQAWKSSKSTTSASNSTGASSSASTATTSTAPSRTFTRPPKDESRSRPTLATDYAPFPLFPLSACTSQSLTEASRASFIEPALAGVRAKGANRSGAVDDPVERAIRTAKEEDWIRDIVYGGQLGEAYARSLERFLDGAIIPSGKDQQGLKRYRDDFLTGTVWAGGGLRYLQDVGSVMRDFEGVGKWARELKTKEQANQGSHPKIEVEAMDEEAADKAIKQEREDADLLMGLSGASTTPNPTSTTTNSVDSSKTKPTPNSIRSKIDQVIEGIPPDRKAQAELALIRFLPLSLSSLLRDPEDFTRPIPPRIPRKRKAEDDDGDGDEKEGTGWPESTLKAVREELMDWIQDDSSRSKTDENRLNQIRLLLLSLTRRAPLGTIEKLGPEDLEMLPEGHIRTHFSQIVR